MNQPVRESALSKSSPTDAATKGVSSQSARDEPPAPLPQIKLKSRGWTLGNSSTLAEGTEDESVWVTLGWIVIPTVIIGLILLTLI